MFPHIPNLFVGSKNFLRISRLYLISFFHSLIVHFINSNTFLLLRTINAHKRTQRLVRRLRTTALSASTSSGNDKMANFKLWLRVLAMFICASGALTISAANAQNILANPGFESNPPTSLGNNLGYSVTPWILTGGGTNVVKVDGPGGVAYGNPVESGPQSDASASGAGVIRHYLDINGSSASFYQSFTVPFCSNGASTNSATYTISGYFSSRDRLTGTGTIALLQGTGLGGTLVTGSSVTANTPVQVTNKTWQLATATVTLTPGQTYSYVVSMNDGSNFDEASVIPANLQCPAVTLRKSTSSTPKQVGETLLYSFTARNTSIPVLLTISNFALSDPKCASAITLQSATVTSDNILQSSETQVYSCTSIPVTQAEYDAGSVINNVTGSGTPSAGSLGPISASLTTPLLRAADLSIVKSDGISRIFSGGIVTYTVIATNNSVSAVTGARVTDIVGVGLTCPPANPVTITGNGVPSGSYTIADLTGAGITLTILGNGQSTTFTYSCQVN